MEAVVLKVYVKAGCGLQEIEVEFDCGDRAGGLAFLRQAFPALEALDQIAREDVAADRRGAA